MAASGSGYKWGLVWFLFCVGALNYGDRTAISSVFPLIRSELNMSDVELAAIGSVFLWAYALASPLCGTLADRFSRARIIVWSLTAWSLITLITGFITSSGQLLFTRVLLGFSEAAYLPAAIALIADYHSSKTRATAIGLHTAGLTFGLVAGGAGAGYVGEHFGWRVGFYLLGGGGLALAALAYFFVRDAEAGAGEAAPAATEREPILVGLRKLVRVPSYLTVIAEAMIVSVGTWIFLNWLPLYFKETYDLSLAAAGFAGTFMLQGAATLGVVLGGVFSDKVAGHAPRRRMLILVVSYLISAPFLLPFLGQTGLIALNLSIFCFSFFGKVGATNETPLICDLLAPKLRSTAIGFMNAANCLAGGIGIMIAGFLKSSLGLGGVFGGISGIMVLAAGIALAGYLLFVRQDLARRARETAVQPALAAAKP